MTDRLTQPDFRLPADPRLSAEDVSRLAASAGAAIRMVADDEATAQAVAPAVSRAMLSPEEFHAVVASERQLRAACGRVMGADHAPDWLRASVAQAIREHGRAVNANAESGVGAGAASVMNVLSETDSQRLVLNLGGLSKLRSFWERSAGWLSVAAVVGVAALGVYSSLRTAVLPADGFSPEYRQNLVHYVEEDHRSCDPNCAEGFDRFPARCTSEVSETLQMVLGTVPRGLVDKIEQLHEAGFWLDGLGRSGMPGDGPSAHVLMSSPTDHRASLFVQALPSRGARLHSNCRYTSERCKKSGSQMMVWRSDNFIYYFYSDDLAAHRAVAEIFNVPTERRSF
jgi:hypothetical protein